MNETKSCGSEMSGMELIFKCENEPSFEAGRDLSVLILCEDAATTDRACDVLQLLDRQLKAEAGRLFYRWWNFAFLAAGELSELFMAEAAAADMIIVGVNEWLAQDDRFGAWLQRLPALRQARPGALIAVLDARADAPNAVTELQSQLQQAAAASRMDFLATRTTTGTHARIRRVNELNAPASLETNFRNGQAGSCRPADAQKRFGVR
jgi:hypothetical protein